MRREAGPWTVSRLVRLVLKHTVFAATAIAIAHGVLAYFVTAPGVFQMVMLPPPYHLEAFTWTTAMAVLLYFDLAIFREQLCLVACPYGRLQGALVDDDTVTIGYDSRRGEPRGKLNEVTGDCLDCNRCVVVCPTGIDIRNGSQLDCVGCAACVDACDDVMRRAHRAPGLVRYDSLQGFAGKATRFVRPRTLFYVGLIAIGATVATTTMLRRHNDAEITVQRLPGAPYQFEGDRVRNSFDAHLVSKLAKASHYTLTVEAPPGAEVVLPIHDVTLEGMSGVHAPIFVTLPRSYPGAHLGGRVTAQRDGSAEVVASEITILGTGR